jgi:hypothetical protein
MAELPAYLAPTFAQRKAAREAAEKNVPDAKQVDSETDEVEDKAVAPRKTTSKRKRS